MPKADSSPLEVVVLAAGKGTRMCSALAKVLHPLAGKPLLQYVLEAAVPLAPRQTHVVVGDNEAALGSAFADSDVRWVHQGRQLGTGHAVSQALAAIDEQAVVLVVYGDVPLIRTQTLDQLLPAAQSGLSLLTATLPEPSGYGRIVRDERGGISRIVEQRDASPDELEIKEINTGFLAAPAAVLRACLARVDNNNEQGEYYLTDVVSLAVADGVPVSTCDATDPWEVRGVNNRAELAALERHRQSQLAQSWMSQGVTIADPRRVDIRGEVTIGVDCTIDVGVVLEGPTVIGDGVQIGANNVIRGSTVEAAVVIEPNCVIDDAHIAAGARIGPFARLRPGTRVGPDCRVGNYVEIKNSELGAGAKVNHLSYIGDSRVGQRTNIGAGTITCNYDGANKHRTDIGDDVFVGSNTQLVAPVKLGQGATIGAGSTITRDVPDHALALGRARQRVVTPWQRPQKKNPKQG